MTPPAPPAAGADVYVGLMSGTSCDGVSAAAARFTDGPRGTVAVDLVGFVQVPYAPAQRERLLAAMAGATPQEYCRLSVDVGAWLAAAAAALLADAGVARSSVRLVASHGQTLWHEPDHSTWQTGDPRVIAEHLGVDVVSDFRARDMAAGGQGAPLVSAADALLFGHATEWRLLQNLGGIGNVTVVPPRDGAADPFAGVRAFDTGPGMALVDVLARRADPALPYDVDGRLAASGTPVPGVVDQLLRSPYFVAPPPKSTGRELFGAAYADDLAARCQDARPAATAADVVATAAELTARSVADAYARFVPEPAGEVLVSGGGARHPGVMAALERALARARDTGRPTPGAPARVRRFDDAFFDGEAKEAVAFALLGYLHERRRPGNVPSATGARGPRLLGALTPA